MLRISGRPLGAVIKHSLQLAAVKGQRCAACVLPSKLRQLVSPIRMFIHTDDWVNYKTANLNRVLLCSMFYLFVVIITSYTSQTGVIKGLLFPFQTRRRKVSAWKLSSLFLVETRLIRSRAPCYCSVHFIMVYLHMYDKNVIHFQRLIVYRHVHRDRSNGKSDCVAST